MSSRLPLAAPLGNRMYLRPCSLRDLSPSSKSAGALDLSRIPSRPPRSRSLRNPSRGSPTLLLLCDSRDIAGRSTPAESFDATDRSITRPPFEARPRTSVPSHAPPPAFASPAPPAARAARRGSRAPCESLYELMARSTSIGATVGEYPKLLIAASRPIDSSRLSSGCSRAAPPPNDGCDDIDIARPSALRGSPTE